MPAAPGHYTILDTKGEGHYAGTVYSAQQVELGWFGEGDDSGAARVEMLHKPFDGAALARGVATFEQDDDFLTGLLHPALDLQ